jgi:hypothetical protein
MARKPNYNFERMERDKAKAAEAAKKAQAKRDRRAKGEPQGEDVADDGAAPVEGED